MTFHAWRIVPGAAFLVLYSRGLLPFEFAASTELIRHLPMGLLPTFAVPVTLAAHVLALRRVRDSRRS